MDNNIVPMPEPKPQPPEKRPMYDYMPTTLREAMDLADMLASSTMVPREYIGKPGNVLVALQMGGELGLKPMQSLQSIAVINGKPGVYGDAGKALLLSAGYTIDELDTREVERRGYAECTIGFPGMKPVTRTFGIDDAKRARLWGKEGPWTMYPFRQMSWRAFWFAARDAAAGVLKGLPPAEELRDMQEIDVTPPGETPPRTPIATVSATSKLKDRLKPKTSDVASLTALFESASSREQLDTAVAKVKAATLADGDRNLLTLAFRAALARLNKQAAAQAPVGPEPGASNEAAPTSAEPSGAPADGGPAPLTDEQIIAGLKGAQTREEIDLYCSIHVSPLADSPRKNLLLTMYNKVRSEFPE